MEKRPNLRAFFFGDIINGTILRIESKDYYVFSEGKIYRSVLRGKFKKDFQLKKDKLFAVDVAAVGDQVEFEINKDGSGLITKILPRKNYLSRKAPKLKGVSYRGERLEQIVAANIDNYFVVCSVLEPTINNYSLDRFLVVGESSHLDTTIIINKVDLLFDNSIKKLISLYRDIGYNVIPCSIISGVGIDTIKNITEGKINFFWGHSGVGKSSIINKIFPSLKLTVGEISKYSGKGKHTTVTVNMIPLENNTFIIDTPGVREIEPFGIRKEDLGHYFIEFADVINSCKFNTCTHNHEPGCAVESAVAKGLISEIRYQSYLRMLSTIEDDIVF